MNQELLLSQDEQKYYDQVFSKLKTAKTKLNQQTLKKLLTNRGSIAQDDIADFIVSQSVKLSKSDPESINVLGFRICMKYLALHQSGKRVKEINILTAENASLPKLTSVKSKEKKERNLESQLMISAIKLDQIDNEEQEESKENIQPAQNNKQGNKYPNLDMSMFEQAPPKFQNQYQPTQHYDNSNNGTKKETAQGESFRTQEEQNGLNAEDHILQTFGDQNIQNVSRIFLSKINTFQNESDEHEKIHKRASIEIRGFQLKEGTYLSKSYVSYNIHFGENSERVERRFKEFEELNNYLLAKKEYQGLIIPKLPPKQVNISQLIGTKLDDSEFYIKRMADLEDYLNKINSSVILAEDPIFLEFLQNKNGFSAKNQNNMFSFVSKWYNTFASQSLQENSEYLQAIITHKFNEYCKVTVTETREIDEIMIQINQYQQHIDNLQQLFYNQYQLEKQKREKIQTFSQTSSEQFDEIIDLENALILQSNQFDSNADKKKKVWKEFRSIYSHIQSAKQSHDMLLDQIKNQQFLNQLKLKKISNQQQSTPDQKSKILQIDTEIQQSEQEIIKTKELLKEELNKFLENLKKKVRASLETFEAQTKEELSNH